MCHVPCHDEEPVGGGGAYPTFEAEADERDAAEPPAPAVPRYTVAALNYNAKRAPGSPFDG